MLDSAPPTDISAWFDSFARHLAARDIDGLLELFTEDCYWRDIVAFTWNVKTLEGKPAIRAMLEATLVSTTPSAFTITNTTQRSGVLEAWFDFETGVGRGQGIARFDDGRCRTILTTLQALKGHEEAIGASRPLGVRHGADRNRRTWTERRAAEEAELGSTRQPYCLIIGGGQGGIMLGARLKQLGVPAIIVERNAKAGDSWRNRYRSLVLHDPVWYDHLPYIPFPPHWPVFTPKDKMGDWLESYVKLMELNYWTGTEAVSARYDAAERRWTVELLRDGEPVTLKPAQLIFATGAYGPPRFIDLPGAGDFEGQILHSSQYSDGSRYKGKRVVVIGAASSGHDICVDLWEAGADVTMVQRSPTTVVRSETLMDLAFDIYSEAAVEAGIDVDKADLIAAATPFALQPPAQRALYEKIRARDADFYRRLEASGFLLDFGEDETGLMMKAYRTGSGYYVDVGASELIISGEIKVKAGVPIERLTPAGIRFADGTEIPADVIIQSTGFQSMHEMVAKIVDRETADAVGPCWGLGSGMRGDPGPWHGELRNMYKPTAQEALWFQGGNLALSRFFSKFLALQLKARYEGLDTPVYSPPLQ
ncbi:NAD(P)/FAD-dependent oxidoreductase [Kaistia dalseonensis]|uniref:Flavoprotein involved in K+ transport n=1 Tax=Kaistia dalseonensis TaxID=410840 RepID=A0ABU0H8K4_9HYPH|nr:NAD(P)/FAD-dependent oxidoreductase [Kaistia dalseonensis]MCX5496046.1 NAD(P)/FAD-dependent oxidoreductase [Kaistia dalseonensis]MDQ0438650.1 putative flavoprotein involved in K+ transport [Kaistia dalseonensis]